MFRNVAKNGDGVDIIRSVFLWPYEYEDAPGNASLEGRVDGPRYRDNLG